MEDRTPDFSGWATKSGLRCSDGRTIMPGAFKHMDKARVPLVWQHGHDNAENVLGHAILEDRAFGTYAYAFFNSTPKALHIKEAVEHGDVTSLSIYANKLQERDSRDGRSVYHGDIKELSLVLAGANPGALIENINLVHGDSIDEIVEEAIIYTGLELEHQELPTGEIMTSNQNDVMHDDSTVMEENSGAPRTIKDVFDTLNEEQRNAVSLIIGEALVGDEDTAEHDDFMDGDEVLAHINNTIQEGFNNMTRNVFETDSDSGATMAHSELKANFSQLMEGAETRGSYKKALAHAADYGINDISLLFPDAKSPNGEPELVKRRTEWVAAVLGKTKHLPFSKVKSLVFDITADEARAKGYIKGNFKKDEVIQLSKRTTGPTTIYKKQKLHRDDMIDIQDFDVVNWLKAEIRLMLEEEIARAILVGDGRPATSEDKIKDPAGALDGNGIRSILHDSDFYSIKVDLPANVQPKDAVKGLIRARGRYRGTGKPDLFVSDTFLTDIMLEEDKFGRPLYETEQVLADKLRVNSIITVDLFDDSADLFGILVNLADYSIGTNKGGELTSFEDFDIDFNQNKYLMETRLSGALTKPFSAIVVRRLQGTEAAVAVPSFNGETNVITVPSATGVVYTIDDEPVTGTVTIDEDTTVEAIAAEGYYLKSGSTTSWSFTYSA